MERRTTSWSLAWSSGCVMSRIDSDSSSRRLRPSIRDIASFTRRNRPAVSGLKSTRDMPNGAFSKAIRNDSSLARTRATSRALSMAMPAWVAYISSSARCTSSGRRPPSGRSTDRKPTRFPDTEYMGANSASIGCHASGSSLTGMSGTQDVSPARSGSVYGT